MHFLIPATSVLLIIIIAMVSGRSLSHQSDNEKDSAESSKNLILLEYPGDPGDGKNFTLKNSLDEDWKKRSVEGTQAQKPFNLVVPVARNFSSLKELAQILKEDNRKPSPDEKLQLQTKNFTLKNSLDEDWKKRSDDGIENQKPFNLVIPVARNFSSLKELADILREDSRRPSANPSRMTNQSYVKGSEAAASDFVIFFTS